MVVLEQQMKEAAAELDFETAARLRDEVFDLRAGIQERGTVRKGKKKRGKSSAGSR